MRTLCICLALLVSGCTTASALDDITKAKITAELACQYATVIVNQKREPTPAPLPTDGCVDGCTCNGTGREKTGDGLDTVECRCPDGCDCKKAADPPLVPIEVDKQCEGQQCYLIDRATGKRYRIINK